MDTTGLLSMIEKATNNPECALYTGMVLGGFLWAKLFIGLLGFGLIYKALDKLALDPFFSWVKKKIYRGKKCQ